tara:strand:- start:70 stop:225 length:156 start_codon:yes stop_codon:yes gene_type:complete
MIRYNGCQNKNHHIDPFRCCGETKYQTLKELKKDDIIVLKKKGINNESRVR